MTALELSALWCVVQVGIVALLGAAATWMLSRRAPGAAATAAAGAATTVLAVTLLAPVPLPAVADWAGFETVAADPAATSVGEIKGTKALGQASPLLDVATLLARGMSAIGELGRAKPRAVGGVEAWVGWALVGGAVIGVLRLVAAARYVGQLRRECVPVVDAATCAAFAELARRLGVRRATALCDSQHVASPAVVGWRRPIVLLPTNRAGWSEEHLRATLAHELAHVARGDFAWRLGASCMQAIHFFHPLVHILTRRLALAQELAADRLAATVSGGSSNYLRSLSELAIRMDGSQRLRAEPIVLPALSTHLTRRIAMLRSTDGSDDMTRRRMVGVAAAGLIALVGAATTALRGSAEAVVARSADAAEANLFARPTFELPRLGGLHQGLFVVRLGELSQRPAFAPLFDDARQSCAGLWSTMFGVKAPPIDLSAIEYVAGVPQLTIEPAESDDDPNTSGRMMMGCGEVVIRFTRDVAWEAWIARYVPKAERKTEGELAYFELPEMPAMGQARMLVAAIDSRTLVATWGVSRLKSVIAGLPEETSAREAAQWKSLDGGLITYVATDVKIDRTMATPKAPRAADILKNVDRYGVGFDLDATTCRAGVRFALACADGASAAETSEAIQGLLPQMKAEIELQSNALRKKAAAAANAGETTASTSPLSAAERAYMRFWMDALDRCQVRIERAADGGAHVRVDATANFPATLQGMQELAARAPAAGDAARQ